MSYSAKKAKDAKEKAHRIAFAEGSEKDKVKDLAHIIEEMAEWILELGEQLKKLKRRSSP